MDETFDVKTLMNTKLKELRSLLFLAKKKGLNPVVVESFTRKIRESLALLDMAQPMPILGERSHDIARRLGSDYRSILRKISRHNDRHPEDLIYPLSRDEKGAIYQPGLFAKIKRRSKPISKGNKTTASPQIGRR